MMKRVLMLLALAIPSLAQQDFDFKTLDKIGAKATDSTNITLEGDTLKLAGAFLDNDDPELKTVVNNLKAIHVRNYEFDKAGQYDPADLAPVRAYLKTLNWTKIVDVKDGDEMTEIYIQALPNSQFGGLAVVSTEPKEVAVIFISGKLRPSDIGRLSGNFGIPVIPNMTVNHDGKKPGSSKKD